MGKQENIFLFVPNLIGKRFVYIISILNKYLIISIPANM